MNKCKYCGIEFEPDRRRPDQDHCTRVIGSRECYEKNKPRGKNHPAYKNGNRTRQTKKCQYCGKKYITNDSSQQCCSFHCARKLDYKEGKRDKKEQARKIWEKRSKYYKKRLKENPLLYKHKTGYMMISVPGTKGVRYHRYLWEKHNGKIPEGYVIHHKDGNKLNNNLDNLQLMSSKEHAKLHNTKRQ